MRYDVCCFLEKPQIGLPIKRKFVGSISHRYQSMKSAAGSREEVIGITLVLVR